MSAQPPVILVTGASRGIGAAAALAFARRGWRVAITARTQSEGQALDHQLRRPDGTMMSGSLDEFHASQMKKPMPTPPVSISAATMASHDRPMPIRRPVKM